MNSNNQDKQVNPKNSGKGKSRGKSKKRVKKNNKEEIIDTTVPVQKKIENNNSSPNVNNRDIQIPPYGYPNTIDQYTQLNQQQISMLHQQYFNSLYPMLNQSNEGHLNRSNNKLNQLDQRQMFNLYPSFDGNAQQSNQVNRSVVPPNSAGVEYSNNMRLLDPVNSSSFNANMVNDLGASSNNRGGSSNSFNKNYIPPDNKDNSLLNFPVNNSNNQNVLNKSNKNIKAKRFKNELYPISSGKIRVFWKGVYHKRKNKDLFSPYAVKLTASTRTTDGISKREREYVCEKCELYIGNMNSMINHVAEEFVVNPFLHPLEYLKPHISLQQYLLLKTKVVVKEIMNGKEFEIKDPNKKNIFMNELIFSEHTREYIDGFFNNEYDKDKCLICCRVNPVKILEHMKEVEKYMERFRKVIKEVKWCNPFNELSDEDIKSIDFKNKRDINLNYDSFHPVMFTIHGFHDQAVKHIVKDKVIYNPDDEEDDEMIDEGEDNNDVQNKNNIPGNQIQKDLHSNHNVNNVNVPNSIENNTDHLKCSYQNFNVPDQNCSYIGQDGRINITLPKIDAGEFSKYKDYDDFMKCNMESFERYMKNIISHKDFDKYLKKTNNVNNSFGINNQKDDDMDLDDNNINAVEQIQSRHQNIPKDNRSITKVDDAVNLSNSNMLIQSHEKINPANYSNNLNIRNVNPNQMNTLSNQNIQIPQKINPINNSNMFPVVDPVPNINQCINKSNTSQISVTNNNNQYPPNYINLPDNAYPMQDWISMKKKKERNNLSVIRENDKDPNDNIGDNTASVNNENIDYDVPKKFRSLIEKRNEIDITVKPKSEIKSNIFSLKGNDRISRSPNQNIENVNNIAENTQNSQNDNPHVTVQGNNLIKIKFYSANEDPDNMPLNKEDNMLGVNDDEDNNKEKTVPNNTRSKKKVRWADQTGEKNNSSEDGRRKASSNNIILSSDNVNDRIDVNKLFSGDKKLNSFEQFSEDKNAPSTKLLNNKRGRGKKKRGKRGRKIAQSPDQDTEDDNENEVPQIRSSEKDEHQGNIQEDDECGEPKSNNGKRKKKDVSSNPRSYKRKKYDNNTGDHSKVDGNAIVNEDEPKDESDMNPDKARSPERNDEVENNKKRKRGKKK